MIHGDDGEKLPHVASMAWNCTFHSIGISKLYTKIFVMDEVMGSKACLLNKSYIVMILETLHPRDGKTKQNRSF